MSTLTVNELISLLQTKIEQEPEFGNLVLVHPLSYDKFRYIEKDSVRLCMLFDFYNYDSCRVKTVKELGDKEELDLIPEKALLLGYYD